MSSLKLSEQSKLILMGLCGGKCEFKGCNELVTKDLMTGEEGNYSNFAHIIARSSSGPRGNIEKSKKLVDEISNVMVLCRKHHKEIDDYPEKFTVEMLKDMKEKHEKYISELMKINKENSVIGVKYFFNISDREININDNDVRKSAEKLGYYCNGDIINLSSMRINEVNEEELYYYEKNSINKIFSEQVKSKQRRDETNKFLLCAIAPQPLLIYLGTLFSDISDVEVQQLQRCPKQGWYWDETDPIKNQFEINISMPKKKSNNVALNISITADISEDRIRKIVGMDCDIIKIESNIKGNDIIKSKEQLIIFEKKIREVYEKINYNYGSDCKVSVFPAMPVSIAVEMGRCWMKKAHPNLVIYDEKGGFKKTIEILYEGENDGK